MSLKQKIESERMKERDCRDVVGHNRRTDGPTDARRQVEAPKLCECAKRGNSDVCSWNTTAQVPQADQYFTSRFTPLKKISHIRFHTNE